MAPTYKLEELLRVREAIKDTAEVVRRICNSECGDHILRSSNCAGERRNRARASSIVADPYDDVEVEEVEHHDGKVRGRSSKLSKYSPTPSIKRGKAEKLLKEHGSPPGVRVTAGGRIVPDGLSSITTPSYGQTNPNGHERDHYSHALPYLPTGSHVRKPLDGVLVDVGGSSLCQVIDGQLRPIEQGNGILHLHMPISDVHFQPTPESLGVLTGHSGLQCSQQYAPVPTSNQGGMKRPFNRSSTISNSALASRELHSMEQVHAKLERELKDLDRNEVLQRDSLNATRRAEIVKARVDLVNRIDESRRAIVNAKKPLPDTSERIRYGITNQMKQNVHSLAQQEIPAATGRAMATSAPFTLTANAFDTSGFTGLVAPVAGGHHFEPTGFLPPPFQTHTMPLQERICNVNNNLRRGSYERESDESSKGVNATVGSGPMNLDGSFHFQRRSYAVEIKNPKDGTVWNKSFLNPASPSYQPYPTEPMSKSAQTDDQAETLSFVPSPTLVARMESLVKSPEQEGRTLENGAVGMRDSSDSSATTADFFPCDTHHYSSTKYLSSAQEIPENLPAWMHKKGDTSQRDGDAIPSGPPNKFLFNDESPEGRNYQDASATDVAAVGPNSDPVTEPISMASYRFTNPKTERLLGTVIATGEAAATNHQARRTDKNEHSDDVVPRSERSIETSFKKNQAYWDGYYTGMQRELHGENYDEEYRVGYRDGLIQSSAISTGASIGAIDMKNEIGENPLMYFPRVHANHPPRVHTVAKSISFPSFGTLSMATPPVPAAPANSLATTPVQNKMSKKEWSPAIEKSLDSPTARAEFMSQPNVNITSPLALKRNSRASVVALNENETAASIRRKGLPGSRILFSTTPDGGSLTTKVQGKIDLYEEKRSRKSGISVAQTNDHARPSFSQYDGSDDQDKPSGLGPSIVHAHTGSKERVKAKLTGSPVKGRASAASTAVATMMQAAGIGNSRREDHKHVDQPMRKVSKNVSSPGKKEWRKQLSLGFRQPKSTGHDGVETYKRY